MVCNHLAALDLGESRPLSWGRGRCHAYLRPQVQRYQGTHISTYRAIQKVIGTALDSQATPEADPCVSWSLESLVQELKTPEIMV